ncbi:MAG: glycoside hydrolase family protein [Armatimonadota bacterium]
MNLYVSKLGDNTDGRSWQTAFHTIQQALLAVSDDRGGHRVIVRPDTYMEANLYPAFKGAEGAYNELVGDFDGRLGSGTGGWVVIDNGEPQAGFKSYDWWGTIRSYAKGWSAEHTAETFSAIGWDRWALRRLYATGGDGGIFFDGTDRVEPFSVLVEDCVSIGRAFGGGVASVLSRTGEPITYRRCCLWALDWWGDTAGAYIRVENPSMPDRPDAVFEDCVMVGPQCALKGGNYGFTTSMWIHVKGCRLVTLNFSQPHGTPSDGIVVSMEHGKYLKVSFEDSTLMGYKVFGAKVQQGTEYEIQYSTQGSCLAYVQFQQEVPLGFHRLGHWPVDVFQQILPPAPHSPGVLQAPELVRRDMCELAPVIWQGRLCHLECVRPASGGTVADYYLQLNDAETGETLARFAEGYSLASAIVHEDTLYAFASRFEDNDWNDVTLFSSSDLMNWEQTVVIRQEQEHLFNTSVCRGPDGFVMAYESNDPAYPPFTIKFAVSPDLRHWTKLPDAVFGTDRYAACPCLRYADGNYYMLYLEARAPRHYFETYIARSPDLRRWWLSAANPVLRPDGLDDGVNASDPELIELNGRTLVYYAVGDQLTWMNVKRAAYPGLLADFFRRWFPDEGIEDRGTASYSTASVR